MDLINETSRLIDVVRRSFPKLCEQFAPECHGSYLVYTRHGFLQTCTRFGRPQKDFDLQELTTHNPDGSPHISLSELPMEVHEFYRFALLIQMGLISVAVANEEMERRGFKKEFRAIVSLVTGIDDGTFL